MVKAEVLVARVNRVLSASPAPASTEACVSMFFLLHNLYKKIFRRDGKVGEENFVHESVESRFTCKTINNGDHRPRVV